jgi:sugar O-acyltransferase (sialic acid O-acetyltransferase NeuD family)
MKKREIVLIGAGGHAQSCIDVIEQEGKYRVVGLVGKSEEVGKIIHGHEVLSNESQLHELAKKIPLALIAVGQIRSAKIRIRLFEKAKQAGFLMASIKSPFAYVSRDVKIGEGTIIMHAAVINAGVRIGQNCIINSKALIEHNATISDNCHVSTGVLINGDVTVSSGSFIGSGSVIREGISIGKNVVVSMGSVIRKNVESKTPLEEV